MPTAGETKKNRLVETLMNEETARKLRSVNPTVERFTKKPVTIEAMKFTPYNIPGIMLWLTDNNVKACHSVNHAEMEPEISIQTLEGVMTASVGDWIIRGVKGEFYPCKPDIFEATYGAEAVLEANRPPLTDAELADIKADKTLRVALDAQIQILKVLPGSAERSTALRKLRECVMWLGMDLKRLNDERPYPSSYDPSTPTIEKTADGLRL